MLKIDLASETNPLVVANEIGFYISDNLRNQSISLYSAFLLHQDELNLKRMGYRQPAWRHRLSISGVLALYMQYLFGLSCGEANVARKAAEWLEEDLPMLGEKRNHYIWNCLTALPVTEPPKEQLTKLSRVRSRYEVLSDDDGPYHTEVFPYDYYSPEDVLLGRSSATVKRDTVEPEVEELMLAISAWG